MTFPARILSDMRFPNFFSGLVIAMIGNCMPDGIEEIEENIWAIKMNLIVFVGRSVSQVKPRSVYFNGSAYQFKPL